MRLLVFGGTGMLGHKLVQVLADGHQVTATRRADTSVPKEKLAQLPCQWRVFEDFTDAAAIATLLHEVKPDVMLNGVGSIRQGDQWRGEHAAINALLPHLVAEAAMARGIKFITLSSDCVFDGMAGRPYTEADPTSPRDSYALSKTLGEVGDMDNTLTIRTSIVGPELRAGSSLLSWILSQRGQSVRGFTQALYTGLPTVELARIAKTIIEAYPDLRGTFQIVSQPVSKAELVRGISDGFSLGIAVNDEPGVAVDRRLDGGKFLAATGYRPRPWPELIQEMQLDYAAFPRLYA